MENVDYGSVTGTVIAVMGRDDCCSQLLSIRTENGVENVVLNTDTVVVDSRQIWQGMRIAAFYNTALPMPLIYPPQYTAGIIVILGKDEHAVVNWFDNSLTAADRSLKLTVGENTAVKMINGQNFMCSPKNHTLLVCYANTTRSIPPQTTPEKIVVLC